MAFRRVGLICSEAGVKSKAGVNWLIITGSLEILTPLQQLPVRSHLLQSAGAVAFAPDLFSSPVPSLGTTIQKVLCWISIFLTHPHLHTCCSAIPRTIGSRGRHSSSTFLSLSPSHPIQFNQGPAVVLKSKTPSMSATLTDDLMGLSVHFLLQPECQVRRLLSIPFLTSVSDL